VSSVTGVSWTKIALASNFAVALRNDGSLWSWGYNGNGELGQGNQTGYVASPINVTGSTTWTQISAGTGFILAINTNGTLWSWGNNNAGQLGVSSTTNSISPRLVSGPAGTSWAAIAAGSSHSLGITTTGRLYGWGYNLFGQVGNFSSSNVSSPVLLTPGGQLLSWASVTAGGTHSLAITTTGRLYGWGANSTGQVGDTTTSNRSSPVLVSGPATTSWSTIGAGSGHSLGITATGQLYAWGNNGNGQLGILLTNNRAGPELVSGPATTSWAAIQGGAFHTLAITTTGELFAWGANSNGQLGDSTTVDKSSPILVSGPVNTSWSSVSSGSQHSLAIATTGRLYAWGSNTSGQLGDNTLTAVSSPILVSGPAATSWIAVSGYNNSTGTWALTSGNILWGWGSNTTEVLGIATNVSSPQQVGTSSWIAISTKGSLSLAITTAGRLYAWGGGPSGSQGDLSTIPKSSPVLVSGPTNTSWSAIAAAAGFGLAISTTGQLWGWGSNINGGVGNNSGTSVSSPVLVSGPASTSWSVVACGQEHALAISTTGQLYAWGLNSSGQLGILSTTRKSSPVLVSGPTGASWIAVSGGQEHSLAITADGTLYAWGRGTFGRLGDNTTVAKSSPILVSGPANTSWSAISAGLQHSTALTSLGQLYTWGYNAGGQLGDSSTTSSSLPVLIPGPTSLSWVVIAAGWSASAGITSES
jgi:alpha-tubulin suppressor-like RCC1 family protein